MKCAIYVRVSTEEQAKKYSIPAQLDLLRSFAQINNHEIFKKYVDEGISGTTLNRPQLRELFNDAERGYFKIVLVYRIDRFFRNTRKLLNAVDELQKMGVSFRSITEPFDTSNPLGSFMISLLGSVAQLERDTLIERSTMGILKSVKEGHYIASTPLYGYNYNSETKKPEINPKESEVIRLIFRFYQKPHMNQVKIAKILNDMSLRTRKGYRWTDTQIHRVLTHSGYRGKWHYTRGSESVIVSIPPLINDETFDEIQQLLKKRKPYGNRKYHYLLLDHLYCGMCGRRMSAKTGNSTRKIGNKTYGPYLRQHYFCFGRKLKKGCRMGWIKKDEIDSLVWQEVKKYIKNPNLIKQIIKDRQEETQNGPEVLRRELVKIASKSERLELEEERILYLYRKGILDEEKLRSQMKQIKSEKQVFNQEKKEIELRMEGEKYLKTRLNMLETIVKRFQKKIDNLNFEKKKEVINLLVNRISLKADGKIVIEMIIPQFRGTIPRQPRPMSETYRNTNFIIPIVISSIWKNSKIKRRLSINR